MATTRINQAVKVDTYPIPTIDDLHVHQSICGRLFTTLDLSNAYHQVGIEEESRKLTIINTTKGLFDNVRLPYGVSSAPGIYQRIREQLLQNIPMTVVYLEDILVSGSTPEEHDQKYTNISHTSSRQRPTVTKREVCFQAEILQILGSRHI